MQIVYDENVVLKKYEETESLYTYLRKRMLAKPICIILIFNVLSLIAFFVLDFVSVGLLCLISIFTVVPLAVLLFSIVTEIIKGKTPLEEEIVGYQYFLLTKGCNVLEYTIDVSDEVTLNLVLEDAEGRISRKSIFGITIEETTSIEEETLNLNEGVYYVPYQKTDTGCKPNTDMI